MRQRNYSASDARSPRITVTFISSRSGGTLLVERRAERREPPMRAPGIHLAKIAPDARLG